MSRGKQRVPVELRWEIWERDGFVCHYCGGRRRLSIDHLLAEVWGGPTIPENLITACMPCNRAKGTTRYEDINHMIGLEWPPHFPGSHAWRLCYIGDRASWPR